MVSGAAGKPTQLGASIRAVLRWNDEVGSPQALYLREGDTLQIGRETTSDVVLSDPGVSRHHAILAWREGGFEIADLGSTNGTRVNNELITKPHWLQNGEVMQVYEVELTFLVLGPGSDESRLSPNQDTTGEQPTFVVPPEAPSPHLIVSAGSEEGRQITLPTGIIKIGRATSRDTWDVSLQDRGISRPHAQIEHQGEGFTLTDLGSANGTRVNGRDIEEPTSLRDGDVIELGETTLLFRAR